MGVASFEDARGWRPWIELGHAWDAPRSVDYSVPGPTTVRTGQLQRGVIEMRHGQDVDKF